MTRHLLRRHAVVLAAVAATTVATTTGALLAARADAVNLVANTFGVKQVSALDPENLFGKVNAGPINRAQTGHREWVTIKGQNQTGQNSAGQN